MSDELCSCGSRLRYKCVKESDSGSGKMCVEEFVVGQEDMPQYVQKILLENLTNLYED